MSDWMDSTTHWSTYNLVSQSRLSSLVRRIHPLIHLRVSHVQTTQSSSIPPTLLMPRTQVLSPSPGLRSKLRRLTCHSFLPFSSYYVFYTFFTRCPFSLGVYVAM